jgi:hypothetical protein
MSAFRPGDWFIGATDFFGALVPGGIALLLLQAGAVRAGWLPASYQPDSVLTWAGFLVAAFVVGYLAHPPAHVLSRAYDRTYAAHRRRGAIQPWSTCGERRGERWARTTPSPPGPGPRLRDERTGSSIIRGP